MRGSVYPRPARRVVKADKRGRERVVLEPLGPNEEWTDPRTGRTVKSGPKGSRWTWQLSVGRGDGLRT